jgi:hydroxymethylpyrimidine/phosphomethylpyrimidine kinase
MIRESSKVPLKVVLTIAGFDPSSGAGITADLKTIAAHGSYGVACITALTVQNTEGVLRVEPLCPELVRATLEALADDISPAAVKIGMLGSGEVAAVVAEFLRSKPQPNVVLDPVLRSSSGARLLDEAGLRVLREELLGLVDVITPNLDEVTALLGSPVKDEAGMARACQELRRMGAKNVVITGGHLARPIDTLAKSLGDGSQALYQYEHERVETTNTHGTGCAYSSSIACHLALGRPLEGVEGAVSRAGIYVASALREAYKIGRGTGPINHHYGLKPQL